MSDSKKIVLPTTKWVELYARLSEYVLEYSSLDPIYNDDGTKTEEKQDEFCDIVDDVENILRMFFIKADETNSSNDEVKTFTSNSWTTFDRTEICLEGIRYTTTESYWCRVVEEDLPKLKSILGNRLYEWALDGGSHVEIPEDEVWHRLPNNWKMKT